MFSYSFCSSLYILHSSPLLCIAGNIFLPLCRLFLCAGDCFLSCAEAFKLDVVPSVSWGYPLSLIRVLFTKSIPVPVSLSAPRGFKVSSLALNHLIYFKLIFMQGERYGSGV